MNNISEQLLKAMDIVVEQKLSQLEYDKTIQAKIFSVTDVDTGEYKVRYNGNIFSAFANDASVSYKKNDDVYVTVPEGDFSNKKLIISKVTSKSLSEAELSSLANSIIEVSPTFDKLYNGAYDPDAIYGVIAGAPVGDPGSQVYIYQGPDEYDPSDYHGMFQQYSNNYEYIRIKASFLTQFYTIHNKGNYGLELEFYTKDNSVVSYRLDLQSFNGNPYGFSVYSPQEIVLKAQKSYLMGLKSIKLFEEGFVYDRIVKGGVVTEEENKTVANIFVKDITIQYVDKKDLSNTTYYLTISAPKGVAFNSKVTSLSLVGRLLYKGEDIMDTKKCVCQWYKRDLSIMTGVEGYSKAAGFGWKSIGDATSDTLSFDASDIIYQQKYKLIVAYNDSVTLSAETEVWNRNATYDYSINQVTEDADIKLQLKNNFDDEFLVGDWYLSYPDGSYSSVQQGKSQSEISVSAYLQYSSVTFYCAVYNAEGQFIGTAEHTVVNSENEDDVTISYTGDDTFRYDANGDVSIEDAERERTLQINLAWKEGFGTSYSVSWLMRDSQNNEYELPTSKDLAYNPESSMLEKLWVDNYNILHYNIKQKYKVNFNNNTIIVRIKTITDSVYSFDKEILCLKDGDQGTNGTTYVTAIRPCSSDGTKLSGLHPLRYNNGWTENVRVRCYVYKDGELINDNAQYSISYKWQGTNVTAESTDAADQVLVRGVPTISADTTSAELAFYVRVQVTIKDNNSTINVYASYPLDVIVGTASVDAITIDSIPSYIKYNSSGLTPSFYSNDINFYYNNEAYNENITSLNTNILTIKEKDGKKYLEPAASFIFENIKSNSESNIGVLDIAIPDSEDRLIHPIIMYLDTYGNEAINGWDGTALDIGDGDYVFAPQVGAGTKDSANKFTGVVMGKDSGQDKIGLYGYKNGVNTFGLREDGTAFFGARSGGGQISVDGNWAIISGGDTEASSTGTITPAANGMYLRLADKNVGKETKAIGIGYDEDSKEENFYVTYDGKLKATDADIQGNIYAVRGQIGGAGRSGGWTIEANKIYSGSGTSRVELDSNNAKNDDGTLVEPMAFWTGSNSSTMAKTSYFAVSKDGKIYASEGSIGTWLLNKQFLTNATNKVGISTSNYAFWAGAKTGTGISPGTDPTFDKSLSSYFYVKPDGQMYCANATIGGSIDASYLSCYAGTIGGWIIDPNSLSSESAYYGGGANSIQLLANDPDGTVISTTYGRIGLVTGTTSSGEVTYNFGIEGTVDSGLGSGSVVIKGVQNIALRVPEETGHYIVLNGGGLTCTIPMDQQYGIGARFG